MARCEWKHHDPTVENKQDLGKCKKHPEQELLCGPYRHKFCLKCEPHLAGRCGICGALRYLCSC